jgi:hypothetical protein
MVLVAAAACGLAISRTVDLDWDFSFALMRNWPGRIIHPL